MCIHGFAFCWKRVKSICILSKARTLMLLNIATDCTLVPDSACQTVSMVEKKIYSNILRFSHDVCSYYYHRS